MTYSNFIFMLIIISLKIIFFFSKLLLYIYDLIEFKFVFEYVIYGMISSEHLNMWFEFLIWNSKFKNKEYIVQDYEFLKYKYQVMISFRTYLSPCLNEGIICPNN